MWDQLIDLQNTTAQRACHWLLLGSSLDVGIKCRWDQLIDLENATIPSTTLATTHSAVHWLLQGSLVDVSIKYWWDQQTDSKNVTIPATAQRQFITREVRHYIIHNEDCSLYVDDFLICYRSKHIHIIEWHLQQCLNKLYDWADTNGFKFSSTKTVCIHFCILRKQHPDLIIKF